MLAVNVAEDLFEGHEPQHLLLYSSNGVQRCEKLASDRGGDAEIWHHEGAQGSRPVLLSCWLRTKLRVQDLILGRYCNTRAQGTPRQRRPEIAENLRARRHDRLGQSEDSP